MPKTKHSDIVDYWSRYEDECGLSVDWSDAHERCWRCGYKSKLERCHITPDSLGGADEPANLVLLCSRCHRDAPNVKDPRFMWIWLRSYGTTLYNTFWILQGMQEFERMFGRKPFADLEHQSMSTDVINKAVSDVIKCATIHFGEGRINPSTIACILFRVEEELMNSTQKCCWERSNTNG